MNHRHLVIVIVALALVSLNLGPGGSALRASEDVLIHLRLARILAAVVVGAGLALAGTAMQCALRNPLADPFLLGMSGSASLGAIISFLLVPDLSPAPLAAAFALGAAAAVLLLARDANGAYPPTRVILIGVAMSAAAGALTALILQLAPESRGLRAALFWTTGQLVGADLTQTAITASWVAAACGLLFALRRTLDRLLLGADTAATLGVAVRPFTLLVLSLAASVTASIVCLAGPVGFVGLIAPHLARLAVGATHTRLIPLATLIGAALVLAADTVARTAFLPREVPVGAITAGVGAIVFLMVVRRRRYEFGGIE